MVIQVNKVVTCCKIFKIFDFPCSSLSKSKTRRAIAYTYWLLTLFAAPK